MATGVLPVFFGRATLLAERLSSQGKAYTAGIRFGATSDTDDAEGNLTTVPIPPGLDAAAVRAALRAFSGTVAQRPPAFSALKVDGRRSYRVARGQVAAGEVPAPLAARPVLVTRAELVEFTPGTAGPGARVEIECGPGFYVRSLARDLGEALGTGAHLESLVRTRVGGLELESAVSLADAEAAGTGLGARLLPVASVAAGLTAVEIAAGDIEELRFGRGVSAPGVGDGDACAVDAGGRLLALGRVLAGTFLPHRLVEL